MRSRRIDVAIVEKNEYNSSEESDDEIMNSSEENDATMDSVDESLELNIDGIILIAQRARLTTSAPDPRSVSIGAGRWTLSWACDSLDEHKCGQT